MLTFEQIKELVELVARQRLQRVEIERSGFQLKIEGQGARVEAVAGNEGGASAVDAVPVDAAQVVPAAKAEESVAADLGESAAADGLHVLHSPIVGTFYSAPNPDADPYVRAGDRVKAGQVLCIVEAMKLMNEIEADVGGVVRETYPKNAQPVEFGEPLFAIEPD